MGQSLDIPRVISDDWKRLDLIINKIKFKLGRDASPTLTGLTLSGLTASRLVQSDSTKKLSSVSNLTTWVAGTTGQITVANDGDGTVTLSIPNPLVIPGKLTAGSFGSPTDVTNTRQYGFEIHYSGNDYDVTGIRSRAQLVTTDTTATAQGALLQAANNDGINAGVLNGALIEAIGKSNANAATIAVMRGALINTEWGDYDTVTNLKTLHVRTHSRNAAGAGSFGTGYGIYIENEAVGGNGQALDAGIYFKGTNLSAGNKAFTYGIDFSGGTFTSEEIKLANGSVIGSDKVTLASTIDSTTFFQIKNAAGDIVGIFDTTNIRFGIGVEPTSKFHILDRGQSLIFGYEAVNVAVLTLSGGQFAEYRQRVGTVDNRMGTSTSFGYFDVYSNHPMQLWTNNRHRVEISASGNVCIGGTGAETLLELTHAQPYLTLHNETHEDSDGGRESRIIFKGEKEDNTEHTLGMQEFSHEGTGDDFLAKYTLSLNKDVGADTLSDILTATQDSFVIQAPTDSTTFFQIKDAAGIQILGADTINKRVIIGEGESNAPLEVKGSLPGDVGGKPSGLLHVTNADSSQFANSVITGHNSYNTNTQLWYLGSTTGTDNNIAFINRQDAALSLWTNNTEALRIDSNGTLTLIGTARVIKHMQFTMELGRGQSAPAERFVEDPYVSFTYAIGDDSHISREVPEDMDSTVASIVKVHWYTTDAGASGDGDEVRWEVQWASRAPGEDLTTGDTTDNSGDIVCSAQNIIVETTVVTIPADSIASGDMLGLHIQRVALGTGNGPTGSSVHVLDVELEYTSNKLGKAT